MRYIGNKTKLLPFLGRAIESIGIAPGVAHDAFAGTASVGRALKATGWRVHSSDLMTYSYVMQRAYVVASRVDEFETLASADSDVRRLFAARNLERAPRRNISTSTLTTRQSGTQKLARLVAIADHLSTGVGDGNG